MDELKLNVYDDNDEIIKTVKAQIVELRFGTVRSLMELLKVDSIDDTGELLKTVYTAWDKITKILQKVFPEMDENDWENIKLTELIPVIILILKNSFMQILTIPTDSKN